MHICVRAFAQMCFCLNQRVGVSSHVCMCTWSGKGGRFVFLFFFFSFVRMRCTRRPVFAVEVQVLW